MRFIAFHAKGRHSVSGTIYAALLVFEFILWFFSCFESQLRFLLFHSIKIHLLSVAANNLETTNLNAITKSVENPRKKSKIQRNCNPERLKFQIMRSWMSTSCNSRFPRSKQIQGSGILARKQEKTTRSQRSRRPVPLLLPGLALRAQDQFFFHPKEYILAFSFLPWPQTVYPPSLSVAGSALVPQGVRHPRHR